MSGRKQGGWVRSARRAALLLLAATPAWAAQVVDVRIGYHPGFARVVFELDSPAGYRVERHAPAPGIGELVITLDATSPAKSIDSSDKSIVEGVELASQGERSVAHVRLALDGLKLKEMILRNPDRIVLDILAKEKPSQAASAVAKAEAKPRKPESEGVAGLGPPKPVPLSKEPAEPRAPAAPGAAPRTLPGEAQSQQLALAKPPAPPPEVQPAPATSRPPPKPAVSPRETTPPRPSAAARPRSRVKPAVVPPPPEESFFTGTVAMAIGAVVLLAAAAVGFTRWRRSSSDDEDEFEDASMDEESPFAGFDAGREGAAESEQAPTDEFAFGAGAGAGAAGGGDTDALKLAGASDQAQKEGSDMDQQVSEDASTVIMDSPPIAAAGVSEGAGASGDMMRMLREFERRISSLETRLDEAVDARERLERQVAAQTEELRVQRAAIARTQRAVRNLSRPEEDAAPTEPALRDPTRPEGPRG